MDNDMEILHDKYRTTIQFSNSISGHLSKGGKKTNTKNICTPMFIAALLTITKTWKQTMFLGGKFRREGGDIYILMVDSHCYVAETNTTL